MILGYQIGVLYPGFSGAPRGELAEICGRHGFSVAARRLSDVDRDLALSTVARRVGSRRKDHLRVVPLDYRSPGHGRAFQIEEVLQQGRESAGSVAGARIVSTEEKITVEAPASGPEIAACMTLGRRLRDKAEWLVTHADTRTVSRAIEAMMAEVRGFRFLSRGSYILGAWDPKSARVTACLSELRHRFYDEASRTGLRASVVTVTDAGENLAILTDAAIDDTERRLLLLTTQLSAEARSESVLPSTLERRKRASRELHESIENMAWLLGWPAARLLSRAKDIRDAYALARSGKELVAPGWIEPETPTQERRSA